MRLHLQGRCRWAPSHPEQQDPVLHQHVLLSPYLTTTHLLITVMLSFYGYMLDLGNAECPPHLPCRQHDYQIIFSAVDVFTSHETLLFSSYAVCVWPFSRAGTQLCAHEWHSYGSPSTGFWFCSIFKQKSWRLHKLSTDRNLHHVHNMDSCVLSKSKVK